MDHAPLSKAAIRRLQRLVRTASKWWTYGVPREFIGYGEDTKAYLRALVEAGPALIAVADATHAFMSTSDGRKFLEAYARARTVLGARRRDAKPAAKMLRKKKRRS